jgi:hypothetical protein
MFTASVRISIASAAIALGLPMCSVAASNIVQVNATGKSCLAAVGAVTCGANNSTVTNNRVNEACVGILVDPSVSGNVTTPNSIFNATTVQLTGRSCSASGRKSGEAATGRLLEQ